MKTLVEIVSDTVEYLDRSSMNEDVTKQDVVESVRNRLSVIMSKLVSYPVCTNFAVPLAPTNMSSNDNDAMRVYNESLNLK